MGRQDGDTVVGMLARQQGTQLIQCTCRRRAPIAEQVLVTLNDFWPQYFPLQSGQLWIHAYHEVAGRDTTLFLLSIQENVLDMCTR